MHLVVSHVNNLLVSAFVYIDAIKNEFLVSVNVNSILYFDYEDYVGATMKDIVGVFDRQDTTEDNVLVYKYNENYYPSLQQKSGNWKSMYIRLNSISGFVDNISLVAKDDELGRTLQDLKHPYCGTLPPY